MRHPRSIHQPVLRALQRLSELAATAGCVVELALCHGTVRTIVYRRGEGESGGVRPNALALSLASTVAEVHRLQSDWVETDVAEFIANANAQHGLQADQFGPGLNLTANASARVLAHKLHLLGAALPPEATDAHDAEFLLGKIQLDSLEQVERIYVRHHPGCALSPAARQLIAEYIRPLTADTSSGR